MQVNPVVVLLLVGSGVAASGQPNAAFATLTVPTTALPAGCALEPAAAVAGASSQGGTLRVWPGTSVVFPSNPWVGSDTRLMTAVHQAVDPIPLAKPDGQAFAASTPSRQPEDEDVREAYRAVYIGADETHTYVEGVRFGDAASVGPERVSALTDPPRGLSRRFVRGATVVRVSATSPDVCTGAILAYIQSLM